MTVETRLEILEGRLRKLRWAVLGLASALALLLLGGAAVMRQDVVRARAVEIFNDQGRVVVALRADDAQGGAVMVAHASDRRKVLLDASPSVVITDRVGDIAVQISADEQGNAILQLHEPEPLPQR